ncbi:methylase [Thermus filiformis]|uniref:Methylase n=1 Tax=Thermus filiformis TaxID=276 RepID=A0A0D6XA22_THEFI|nr:methylase [Thermus filiformis]
MNSPSPIPPWLSPLLACPRCHAPLEGATCPACGPYPFREGFLDLRAFRERPHLRLVNALPPVAWLYDLWRRRAPCILGGLSLEEELARLLAWLGPTGGPFLDVGTGTGLYREALGERAVGLDPSLAFLRVAQRRRPGAYLLGHGEALPFRKGSLSGVAIGPTWNEFLDPSQAAREARRVLRPGGRLFGMLLLGPGPGLGLWRPREEEAKRVLEEAGFRVRLEVRGRLGLLEAEAL